jgi:hypothetical protein
MGLGGRGVQNIKTDAWFGSVNSTYTTAVNAPLFIYLLFVCQLVSRDWAYLVRSCWSWPILWYCRYLLRKTMDVDRGRMYSGVIRITYLMRHLCNSSGTRVMVVGNIYSVVVANIPTKCVIFTVGSVCCRHFVMGSGHKSRNSYTVFSIQFCNRCKESRSPSRFIQWRPVTLHHKLRLLPRPPSTWLLSISATVDTSSCRGSGVCSWIAGDLGVSV